MSSDIQLDSVYTADGTAGELVSGSLQPSLGSRVTFKTVVEPLEPREYPLVGVQCYQDVNGDGKISMDPSTSDLVYLYLDKPDAWFPLGGGSSAG